MAGHAADLLPVPEIVMDSKDAQYDGPQYTIITTKSQLRSHSSYTHSVYSPVKKIVAAVI